MLEGLSCAVQDFLFAVAEPVILWVNIPVVVPLLLLACREVAMRFDIEAFDFVGFLGCAVVWVEHLLGVLEAGSGHTKCNIAIVRLLRPLILPLVALSKRLAHMRLIFALFDIVKFVREALQVLRR